MSFLHYDYSDNFPFSGHLESMSNRYILYKNCNGVWWFFFINFITVSIKTNILYVDVIKIFLAYIYINLMFDSYLQQKTFNTPHFFLTDSFLHVVVNYMKYKARKHYEMVLKSKY